MPNSKVYQIKINGVQQAITELDAVLAKAEDLERKLSRGMTVEVNAKTGGQQQAVQATLQVQKEVTAQVEAQTQALERQTSIVQQQAGGYKEALSVATSILGTYDENIAKLAEYDSKLKEIKEQKKAVQDIGVENEQTRAIMQELLADEVKYKQLKSETLSVIKTETKLLQATEGSYDQMSAAVGRLRDALRASGGNLSPEQFNAISQAVTELDTQLKDADKGMGQFFRNVGNYPSAAEGFSKIKVEIAGITQEFDGARPAIMSLKNAMSQLAVEGKTDTEEYKALADQMRNLQLAMVTVNDEINRSKDASAGLHDTIEMIQGFTAIATIGQGFSQLFGMDDSELGEQIKKMTTLMGILQGLNELKNQMATGTGIGPALNKLMDITGLNSSLNQLKTSFSELMTGLKSVRTQSEVTAVGFDIMAASAKVASAAVKSLWRALLVGLVIEAVVWIIDGLVDGIKALYNMVHDYVSVADDAEAANKALAHSYELVAQQVSNYNEVRDHEVARGDISKEIADMEKMLNIQQQLSKYAGITEGAFMLNAENADITPVLHQYDEFEQRIQAINEKNEQGLKIGDDMDKLYNDVLADLAARWLEVDKNDQQAIEGFMEWYKQAPLYQQAVKWAIDTGDVSMKQFASTINDAFNNVGSLVNQFYNLKAAADSAVASANATVDYYVNYVAKYGKNASAASARDKALAEIDNANRSEEQKAEARKLVEQEYEERTKAHVAGGKKVAGAIRRNNNDILNLERQLQQDRLALMRDGLTKTLTQLEYERRRRLEEIDKMSASESKKEEARAAAKARYDHEEAEERKKWREGYLKAEEEFNANLRKQNQELRKQELEYDKAQSDMGLNNRISELDKEFTMKMLQPYYEQLKSLGDLSQITDAKLKDIGETLIRDVNRSETILKRMSEHATDKDAFKALSAEYESLKKKIDSETSLLESLNQATETYRGQSEKLSETIEQDILDIDDPSKRFTDWNEYYEALFNLHQYWNTKNLEIQKRQNDIEAEQQIDALSKELETQRKALSDRYDILLNDEKAIEETGKTKVELQEQYEQEMFDLVTVYRSREGDVLARNLLRNTELTNQYIEDTKSAYSDMYSSIINELNKYISTTDRANSRLKSDNTDSWGFFNIKNFREQREDVLREYEGIFLTIQARMQKLREDFAAGKISLGDFTNAYSELEQLKEQISDTLNELKGDNGMEDFMKGVDTWVQQIGQAANQILSAVFDYRNSEFERMQEELDKQIELVQQKYDEMEELAQRHKDNMSEIEDELTTARGDRRQHLIDALSTEIDAQRRALAEQKKAEKEKEKLEKQSDKLELQRKKEQKRQSLITAIINAALAISQAAANKWPVPAIPLMAVAAAVGAAQVASISAQKYAKGGLLQGPSHERGGIKVGGGIEVEGGEFVTNKGTTSKNLDLLYYINSSRKRLNVDDFIEFYSKGGGSKPLLGAKGKFADGGLMPSLEVASRTAEVIVAQDDRPVVVSVVDINNAQARVRRVQTMAGLER